ncbi:MAG TPA: asparagine synthase (glutamine-hydrolyzing) [Steroidobacteraceae bacterium]|jgi:asparagine synthase (glutamine-hydrolysing)|nr:asparagine synthase (glutamine-hydrolyzing) [Steroidobacteraceae bacterium]
MCGIVGFQGDFSSELLGRMTLAVAHRGPDGSGTVMRQTAGQPPTGLGHRRLAIIDLSAAGLQPMTVEPDAGGGMQTGLTLIFNGEIYNYRELRAELVAAGHRFRTLTDSEVLLHLYERDGFGMLARLNGIFAFAIHDARPAGRPDGMPCGGLFLARDQLGVKPLYYAHTTQGFLFGSEIKALVCDAGMSRDIDAQALHYTLAYLWTPAPRTMLAAVRKLEPGTALLVHSARVQRQWSYYDIPYNGTTRSCGAPVLARELADHVSAAVRRQLVADVPVGAFLSGGLDSSAVVAMMRRALPDRPITCFTVAFRGGANGEAADNDDMGADLPYARRVAAHLGVALEEVVIEPEAISRLGEMVELLDEPQADPAPINALMIAERARAMGIPVLLSGAGGDDLFGGYRRHRALSLERRWAWLPRPMRAAVQSVAAALAGGQTRGQSRPTLRRAARALAYAGEQPDRRLISYFWWSTEAVRRALYSPEFAREVQAVDTAAPLLESLRQIEAERDPLQRMLFLETRHFLADHNLNYTDRAGMAVGVEVRVPLLDVEVVQFATQVPANMKQQGRVGKAIFKHAMEPYLPREVIYRPKMGFGAPLRRWLRRELRPTVDDTLDAAALRRRGFFDPAAVQRLIAADRAGTIDGSYTIFALMCFELWCRRFVDR